MSYKILTISIAAYNMEHYLNRCIDSVINSDFTAYIDLIVVNDGSSDNTLKIALDYQSKFPDTIRVIDKQNGGYGSATNTAMYAAKGKYFKVLDADDCFDTNALNYLINYLSRTDKDLIITNYSKENNKTQTSIIISYKGIEYEKTYDFTNFCIKEQTGEFGFAMHSITYKTSLLTINNFQVSECYYSDVDYSVYPLVHIKSLVFIDIVLYKYYVGREGQSVSNYGLKTHINDHLYVCKKLIDFYTDFFSKINDTISLNIGYNALNVAYNITSVMYWHIYKSDKNLAMTLISDFLRYLRQRDRDIYILVKERSKYYEKYLTNSIQN